MKQMRIFIGAYIEARARGSYLLNGKLAYEHTNNAATGCNAPLDAFVDIDSIPHLREMLVDKPVGKVVLSGCEPCGTNYRWTPEKIKLFYETRKQFRVSKRLQALVPYDLCPADSCTCLHSRLESDFRDFLGNKAGSAESIARDIEAHIKFGGFSGATTLYVAGEYFDAYKEISHFERVTAKPNYHELRTFEKAMLDLEVCKNALYHVGTSYSIFDEWISEDRLLMDKIRSLDYKYGGIRDFHKVKNHGFV